MRKRRLRHKSLVLCEWLTKQWRREGDKDAHVVKGENGFYFVSFDKESRGGFYYG